VCVTAADTCRPALCRDVRSLAYRLQKARQDHEYEQSVKEYERMEMEETYELRREDWIAVQMHKALQKRAELEEARIFAAKARENRQKAANISTNTSTVSSK
jgi:hypothetical protein